MLLPFSKYHGLGNDFIVIEAEGEGLFTPELAQRLCDRHFGVGADGVLLLSPSETADARLVILNADGSRPEMCGNGLRCVALHLKQRGSERGRLAVATDAGLLDCELEERGDVAWITLTLGRAQVIGQLSVRGQEFTRISVGNPHAVLFDGAFGPEEIDGFAKEVSGNIAGGANIEFARVVAPKELNVVVWERGVGWTLACGTGAVAAVVAAATRGLVPYDDKIEVRLPGGLLEVVVRREDLACTLSGPAVHVFDGSVEVPAT